MAKDKKPKSPDRKQEKAPEKAKKN